MVYTINGEQLTRRELVTIDGSKVTSETGIPLMLNINLPGVKALGADVRLAHLNGTPIARGIECKDVPNTDDVTIHYPFDTVASTDSTFWVYWGNADLTEPAASSTYGSESVWDSNFISVWLMNNDPSSSNLLDSTSNNNYGSMLGSMTSGDLIDSPYGKGIDFDGVDDAFTLVNAFTMPSAFTTEVFANLDNTVPEYSDDMVGLYVSADDFLNFEFVATNEIGWHVQQTGNSDRRQRTDNNNVVVETDQYYVLSKTGDDDVDVFIDGTEETTRAAFTADDWAADNRIAGRTESARNHYVDGKIYTIRQSNIKRSANFISTTQNNYDNPTASGTTPFYKSFGNPQHQRRIPQLQQ